MSRKGIAWVMTVWMFGIPGAIGCGDSDGADGPDVPDEAGLEMCCTIGAVCHAPGQQEDDIDECHDIGHENDPAQCRANYDRCMDLCMPAGQGGHGGEPVPHACSE